MLYALILTVHLVVCLILIAVILLQAGRGGGLSDMGGGGAQALLGTRGTTFLTRATTACAVIFMLTSLSLAALSAQKGRSLMDQARPAPARAKTPVEQKAAENAASEQPAPAPAEQPAPAPAEPAPAQPQS